jgi:putative transposon-encoded protein
MDRHEIEGHEVIEGTAKATGNGAHVLVPKRWRGADVKIVRTSDPEDEHDG